MTSDHFKETGDICDDVYLKKNGDYGNSVDITYALFGETAILIRLWDKLLRLTTLHLSGKSNVAESFADTLLDARNYSQIGLAQVTHPKPSTAAAFEEFDNLLNAMAKKGE